MKLEGAFSVFRYPSFRDDRKIGFSRSKSWRENLRATGSRGRFVALNRDRV